MIIRMRNVIIAFLHSLSERPRRSKIDIWTGALFPHFLGLAGNGRAIELEADLASATTDSVRSQIWGHGSGIPSLLRPIQNSGWSCFRYRSLASFHTRRTACSGPPLLAASAARLRRSVVPSMSVAPLAFTAQERGRPRTYSAASAARCRELRSADNRAAALGRASVLHAPLVWLRYKLHLGLAEFRTGAHRGLSSDLQTSAPTGTTHEVTS